MRNALAIILGLFLCVAQVFLPACATAEARPFFYSSLPPSQSAGPAENKPADGPQAPGSEAGAQKENPKAPDTPQENVGKPTQAPPADQQNSSPATQQPEQSPQSPPDQASPATPVPAPQIAPEQTQQAVPQEKNPVSPVPANRKKTKRKSPSHHSTHSASHGTKQQATAKPSSTTAKPSSTTAKPRPQQPTSVVEANGQPQKRVVREGGTSEPKEQLSPGISDEQASHARQNVNELLASTDENLKKAAERSLNATQQETLAQIRKFMDQANAAVTAGDVQRGHNLALKAHMLSDDLLKH